MLHLLDYCGAERFVEAGGLLAGVYCPASECSGRIAERAIIGSDTVRDATRRSRATVGNQASTHVRGSGGFGAICAISFSYFDLKKSAR